jgi:hypothetical protein
MMSLQILDCDNVSFKLSKNCHYFSNDKMLLIKIKNTKKFLFFFKQKKKKRNQKTHTLE